MTEITKKNCDRGGRSGWHNDGSNPRQSQYRTTQYQELARKLGIVPATKTWEPPARSLLLLQAPQNRTRGTSARYGVRLVHSRARGVPISQSLSSGSDRDLTFFAASSRCYNLLLLFSPFPHLLRFFISPAYFPHYPPQPGSPSAFPLPDSLLYSLEKLSFDVQIFHQ